MLTPVARAAAAEVQSNPMPDKYIGVTIVHQLD